MRVIISSTTGLWLSRKAVLRARELKASWADAEHTPIVGEKGHFATDNERSEKEYYWDRHSFPSHLPRHDPILLQLFDELGQEMVPAEDSVEGDRVLCLDIPDDVEYSVGSYVGEWIAEKHRVWDEETPMEGRLSDWIVFSKSTTFDEIEARLRAPPENPNP